MHGNPSDCFTKCHPRVSFKFKNFIAVIFNKQLIQFDFLNFSLTYYKFDFHKAAPKNELFITTQIHVYIMYEYTLQHLWSNSERSLNLNSSIHYLDRELKINSSNNARVRIQFQFFIYFFIPSINMPFCISEFNCFYLQVHCLDIQ